MNNKGTRLLIAASMLFVMNSCTMELRKRQTRSESTLPDAVIIDMDRVGGIHAAGFSSSSEYIRATSLDPHIFFDDDSDLDEAYYVDQALDDALVRIDDLEDVVEGLKAEQSGLMLYVRERQADKERRSQIKLATLGSVCLGLSCYQLYMWLPHLCSSFFNS